MTVLHLDHFYRTKLIQDDNARGDFTSIAWSSGIGSKEQCEKLVKAVHVGSHSNRGVERDLNGYILGRYERDVVFAQLRKSRVKDRGRDFPEYHGVWLPAKIVPQINGRWDALRDWLAGQPRQEFSEVNEALEPLALDLNTLTPLNESRLVEEVLSEHDWLYDLFDALLSGQQVTLIDVPDDQRFRIAQAFSCLLPGPARSLLTFATEVFESKSANMSLRFAYYNINDGTPNSAFWRALSAWPVAESHPYRLYLNTRRETRYENLPKVAQEQAPYLQRLMESNPDQSDGAMLRLLGLHYLARDHRTLRPLTDDELRLLIDQDVLLNEDERLSFVGDLLNRWIANDAPQWERLLSDDKLLIYVENNRGVLEAVLPKDEAALIATIGLWLESYPSAAERLIRLIGWTGWEQRLTQQNFTDQQNFIELFYLLWDYGVVAFVLDGIRSYDLYDAGLPLLVEGLAQSEAGGQPAETLVSLARQHEFSPAVEEAFVKGFYARYGMGEDSGLDAWIVELWLADRLPISPHEWDLLVQYAPAERRYDVALTAFTHLMAVPPPALDVLLNVVTAWYGTQASAALAEQHQSAILYGAGRLLAAVSVLDAANASEAVRTPAAELREQLTREHKRLLKLLDDLSAGS